MRPTAVADANLIEIFSSIQGEGPYLGCHQAFVRFAHCNLGCAYCDTPFAPTEACRLETVPGSGETELLTNPVSGVKLLEVLDRWLDSYPGLYHSISLTGGEPLVQHETLALWLPQLRERLPVYLETNGTLAHELEQLLPLIDIVAMDIKLPSLTKEPPLWDLHRRFLEVARRTEVFIKVVFWRDSSHDELEKAARLVAETAPGSSLILQPLTDRLNDSLTARELQQAQQLVARIVPGARVIPQTHNYLGVL